MQSSEVGKTKPCCVEMYTQLAKLYRNPERDYHSGQGDVGRWEKEGAQRGPKVLAVLVLHLGGGYPVVLFFNVYICLNALPYVYSCLATYRVKMER